MLPSSQLWEVNNIISNLQQKKLSLREVKQLSQIPLELESKLHYPTSKLSSFHYTSFPKVILCAIISDAVYTWHLSELKNNELEVKNKK